MQHSIVEGLWINFFARNACVSFCHFVPANVHLYLSSQHVLRGVCIASARVHMLASVAVRHKYESAHAHEHSCAFTSWHDKLKAKQGGACSPIATCTSSRTDHLALNNFDTKVRASISWQTEMVFHHNDTSHAAVIYPAVTAGNLALLALRAQPCTPHGPTAY